MSAIYLMLPVSLLLAGIFLVAYWWSVRSGQFEDTTTPALRILPDDPPVPPSSAKPDSHNHNIP
ncbi:MAG: cbb3-type cytochrome oxidase assembly protein CcoS [Limisphaerales bacterium]